MPTRHKPKREVKKPKKKEEKRFISFTEPISAQVEVTGKRKKRKEEETE